MCIVVISYALVIIKISRKNERFVHIWGGVWKRIIPVRLGNCRSLWMVPYLDWETVSALWCHSSLQGFATRVVVARDDVISGSGNAHRSLLDGVNLNRAGIGGVRGEQMLRPARRRVRKSITRTLASWVGVVFFDGKRFVVSALTAATHRLLIQRT